MEEDLFRPDSWDGFVGQDGLKRQLQVSIEAACKENRPMEHVLLTGPPGFGKTTLAGIIARSLGDAYSSYMMPVKDTVLQRIVRTFSGVVLFDEIHRLSDSRQEELLPLLESKYLQLPNGARLVNEWLTVIGATTEREKIIGPLWDRFALKPELEKYTSDQMAQIVSNMAVTAEVTLTEDDMLILGSACGGIPRNARSFVLTARDLAVTTGRAPSAEEVLTLARVGNDGLSVQHELYLKTLDKLGGRAGIKPMSMMLRLHESVIMELERLLIDLDYVTYGARGRELTDAGYKKLRDSGTYRRHLR